MRVAKSISFLRHAPNVPKEGFRVLGFVAYPRRVSRFQGFVAQLVTFSDKHFIFRVVGFRAV